VKRLSVTGESGWKRDAVVGAIAGVTAVPAVMLFALNGAPVSFVIKMLLAPMVPGYSVVLRVAYSSPQITQLLDRAFSSGHSDLVSYVLLALYALTNALIYAAAWVVIRRAGRRSRVVGFVALVLCVAIFVALGLGGSHGL
jgi:hypothetical protein